MASVVRHQVDLKIDYSYKIGAISFTFINRSSAEEVFGILPLEAKMVENLASCGLMHGKLTQCRFVGVRPAECFS